MADEIEQLYRRRASHLIGMSEWLVGSRAHAEEIVHDVFGNLLARPPALRGDQSLDAYVRRAVVNGGNTMLRRRILERRHATTDRSEVNDTYADEPVRVAVRGLPLRQRQCVVLRFYEDLSVDQIARDLGMRPGTVKSHLHRALVTLERRLAEGAHL